jgi:hypothetical protein
VVKEDGVACHLYDEASEHPELGRLIRPSFQSPVTRDVIDEARATGGHKWP